MLKTPTRILLALLLAIATASGCSDDNHVTAPDPVASHTAEVPLAWFDLSLTLTRQGPGFTPPVASRAFGYAGVTLYEAMVPGMPEYRTLAGQLNGLAPLPAPEHGEDYHWPTVANSALAAAFRYLYPNATAANRAAIDSLENRFEEEFRLGVDPAVFERSAARGRVVADAVYIWSISDNGHGGYAANFPATYTPPTGPGLWEPTPRLDGSPPQRAMQPTWGSCRPMVLPAGGDPNLDCDPGLPLPFSSEPESPFYAEALDVFTTVRDLTAEERAVAVFWSDDPGVTATPPGHSISILNQVLARENASLEVAAEAYAKVGIAVCDAFISCWAAKYRYNLLRPITYIRRYIPGGEGWVGVLETPPFPEYTSGHSVQSGAAFQVLTDLFGESYAFTDHTHDSRGLPARSFASFNEAAEEAAVSRLYGGIHYMTAINRGVVQGRCLAEAIAALPVRGPGAD